jgi:DNA-binding GntR family transcriptional regulator
VHPEWQRLSIVIARKPNMLATVAPSITKVHLLHQLRGSILSGKYKPGDRLNESQIARELGISRIPVREALSQLQEAGLVTNRRHRGMFVTLLSEEDTQQINSIRIILETEAFTLARAHMTPEIAAKMTNLVNRMENWNGQLSEAAELDLDFHRSIWEASGNSYLVKTLESLATGLFAHKTLDHVSHPLRQWRLNHHRVLLNVLLSTEEQDIAAALLVHLNMAYKSPGKFSSLTEAVPVTPYLSSIRKKRTIAARHVAAAR